MEETHPRVFISYAWEGDEHKEWVERLAIRLRSDGVVARIDGYDLRPGDDITQFMEKEIVDSEYVLIICTPEYKRRSDERTNGVGYEGHIIANEILTRENDKNKFIPIISKGSVRESCPLYLSGALSIDLSDNNHFENNYRDLLATLYDIQKKLPLGDIPTFSEEFMQKSAAQKENAYEDIKILGIITNEVTLPRYDGTRGSVLYSIPFKLSEAPSKRWIKFFLNSWNHPPQFTTMHRPRIAAVEGDRIILAGTTIEEVKNYHRDTLLLCVEEANKKQKASNNSQRLNIFNE